MQNTITRKIFGQAISYQLHIEENRIGEDYHIRVECLEPKRFQQILGNSPQLLKNQLLSVAKDAAYAFNPKGTFEEPLVISSTEKDMYIRARCTSR